MAAEEKKKEAPGMKNIPKFRKEQILLSSKYNNRRDLLSVLLVEGQEYSFDDVDAIIDKFMKRKVK